MKKQNYLAGAGLALLASLMLATVGCQSFNGPPPGQLAAVTITNQTMAAVQNAVAGVFAAHGFEGGQTGPNQFNYTRLGSRMNDLAYGNAMFNEVVTVKVVVTTLQQAPGAIRLSCNAWLIEDANDPVFQDSHQVRQFRKWPYEQLLVDIQKQFGQ